MSFIQGKMPYDELLTVQVQSCLVPYSLQTTTNYKYHCRIKAPTYPNTLIYQAVPGIYHLNTNFTLNGGVHRSQNTLYKTLKTKKNTLFPILSAKQYKLQTRSDNTAKASLGPGTSEGALLQQQLLKECQTTCNLMNLSNLMKQKHQRKRKDYRRNTMPQPRGRRNPELSPDTLRKKLPSRRKQKTSSSSSTSSTSSKKSSSSTSSNSSDT